MTADAGPHIGIVECGFVGQGLVRLFGDCPVYDPAKGQTDREAINRCRFAFVCVPTPTGPHGECDTGLVEETVRWVESEIIVLRSTVAPGTTDRLRRETGKRIVFQPEYIGETAAHPLLDHHAHGFSVLGGPIEDTSPVADLYKGFYHAAHRFYLTTALTAEVAKYMENSFYAVKVTFCNEFFDIGKQNRYPALPLTVIYAQEVDVPVGEERVEWKLLTNLPVETFDDAVEKLQWYAMRWKIETYHKILKSGCKAEESRLRTAQRLTNLLAIYCILAWRVFWLCMVNWKPPLPIPLT